MMRYLLDTHTLLWFLEDSPKLSAKAREIISDVTADISVSIASSWELAIKLSLNKIEINCGLEEFHEAIDKYGFATIGVEREYVQALLDMPFHHKDPFDRLLIATALLENMTLITVDEEIPKYGVSIVW